MVFVPDADGPAISKVPMAGVRCQPATTTGLAVCAHGCVLVRKGDGVSKGTVPVPGRLLSVPESEATRFRDDLAVALGYPRLRRRCVALIPLLPVHCS